MTRVPSYSPRLRNTVGDEGDDETIQVGEGDFVEVRGDMVDVEVDQEGADVGEDKDVNMSEGDGDDKGMTDEVPKSSLGLRDGREKVLWVACRKW